MKTTNKVPAEIKHLRGTYRQDRERKPVTFKTLDEIPKAPAHFTEDKARAWDAICTHLAEAGHLREVTLDIVRAYCNEYGNYLDASNHLEKEGTILSIQTKRGVKRQISPLVGLTKMYMNNMIIAATHLGLTPLAVSKIKGFKQEPAPERGKDGFNF